MALLSGKDIWPEESEPSAGLPRLSQPLLNRKKKIWSISCLCWSSLLFYRTDENKQYIQHASTRNFIFIVRLCDNPFSFGIFFVAVHLFLLAQWLPLCNYARHIGQKLKESIKSADLSGSTVRHSRLWVLRHHFPELTLLSVSLYCCTKSPITSSVYPFGLCHSDLSKRYSIFLLALFKMKFIMDRVVSCTVVLASCWDRRYLENIWQSTVHFQWSVVLQSQHWWISLTLRPCVKKALLQTGGRDITLIMESRRGRGMTSGVWKTVETSGWAS